MCIKPIPDNELENMKKFQYKSTDDSLLYNKCMSPCLNKVVEYFPLKLAPNVITLFSLGCNIIAALITYIDVGFDFSLEMHKATCLIQGLTQILYQLLDNLDGKQARRTGTSSPFGMLLDHGCDIFTNCLTAFNMSHLLVVGNHNILSYCVFFGLIVGFFAMTYEELKIGELHFPIVNATDEGNIILSSLGILCGLIGNGWLGTVLFKTVTLGGLFSLFVFFGGCMCIYSTFKKVYMKEGLKSMLWIFVDWATFFMVLLFPIINILFCEGFYVAYKGFIIFVVCCLFARITINLQITIVTMAKLEVVLIAVVVNVLMIGSFFISIYKWRAVYLGVVFAIEFGELIAFVIIRSRQIMSYLGIKLLTIEPKIQVKQNQEVQEVQEVQIDQDIKTSETPQAV
jgi:ethanolaminephosphotransferase